MHLFLWMLTEATVGCIHQAWGSLSQGKRCCQPNSVAGILEAPEPDEQTSQDASLSPAL